MKLEEAKLLSEELTLAKFKYIGKNSHDRRPRVLILDPDYPGRVGEKNYGKTSDILGINLRHVPADKRKGMKDTLSAIDLFSDFLNADKLERYNRIKEFYPASLSYIRRYKKAGISHYKEKRGMFYKTTSFTKSDPDLNN